MGDCWELSSPLLRVDSSLLLLLAEDWTVSRSSALESNEDDESSLSHLSSLAEVPLLLVESVDCTGPDRGGEDVVRGTP